MLDTSLDELLMDRVAHDDPAALEPLIRRHASGLMTFIHRMVGQTQLAEDVFQEVTLRLWRYRKRYKLWQGFRPWLFTIAANEARRALRDRPIRFTTLNDNVDVLARIVTPEALPQELLIDEESDAHVRAALACLPVKHREVVVLRIWGQMSYSEIGLSLQRRESTVRSQMHHALAKLRELLGSSAPNREANTHAPRGSDLA